jgi:hypothetical protein
MLQPGSEDQSHTTMAGLFILQEATLFHQHAWQLCGEMVWSGTAGNNIHIENLTRPGHASRKH